MRASLQRALFLAVIAVLVAGALVYAFWPQPLAVDIAAIERGPVRVTVDGEGRTRVRDVFVVSAPLAGRIARIRLRPGDPVVANQTVVTTIEATDPAFLDVRSRAQIEAEVRAAEARRDLARADLERARAELEFARTELQRMETLFRRETVTARALDLARLEARTHAARVANAEAALRMRGEEVATARAALIEPGDERAPAGTLCCVPVRSPESGRVLRVIRESESVVQPGEPLVEIGDPQDLEIVVDLPSESAVRVREGAGVAIEAWGGDEVLTGRVRRVEPYGFTKVTALGIEEQRVNVIIDFLDPSEERAALGHGYRVFVRITVVDLEDVPRVPAGALFRDAGRWAVFVAEAGRANLRHLRLGPNDGRHAEIRDGLSPGEHVVVFPSDQVVDGIRIEPRT